MTCSKRHSVSDAARELQLWLNEPYSGSESYSSDLAAAHNSRCIHALETGLGKVHAYQDWRPLDPGPQRPTHERYQSLPLLTKKDLQRLHPQSFALPSLDMSSELSAATIELVRTNGTTSEAVETVWWQPWWDASEAASWRLNAHTQSLGLGEHREALLASSMSVGPRSDGQDLRIADRRTGRFLFLNEKSTPVLWSLELMDRMLHELDEFAPEILEANPSYLARLSHHSILRNARVFQPKAVILTYELPSANHLKLIQRVFRCPVISSYGTTECGYVFMQCEHGRFHENTRFCHVDFLPLDGQEDGDPLGRLVVTTFGNPWRVLLRFVTGDIGRLQAEPCACGRRDGILLRRIEGREHNLTIGAGGNLLSEAEVDDCLSLVDGILDYQLVCRGGGQLSCNVTPTGFVNPSDVASGAESSLATLYGPCRDTRVSIVSSIAPTISGKYRRILSDS